ncbi:hypothetical protein BH09VER1_BH09VER1_07170 [soil metagenome]
MPPLRPSRRISSRAFTFIELLSAIAIILLLASLVTPSISYLRNRAQSAACANNLRQIDLAMNLKVQDNNNTFPKVETDPSHPIYPSDAGAQTLAVLLQPYGVTDRTLRCPTDAEGPNYFAQNGCSYQWFPLVDGEVAIAPGIYLPAGALQLPLARIPEASDYSSVHQGRQNVLFADGHIGAF